MTVNIVLTVYHATIPIIVTCLTLATNVHVRTPCLCTCGWIKILPVAINILLPVYHISVPIVVTCLILIINMDILVTN